MSTKLCLETVCDRCGAKSLDHLPRGCAGEPPIPPGWAGFRLGPAAAMRHLCTGCSHELRDWFKSIATEWEEAPLAQPVEVGS